MATTETLITNNEILNSYVGMVQEKIPTTQQVIESPFAAFMLFAFALWLIRVVILKTLVYIGRTPYAESYRITKRPVITDKQLEREAIWVYGYGYDTIAIAFIYWTGFLNNLPIIEFRGFFWMLVWHAVVVEPIYYAFHRLLHYSVFYKNFHQYHHKSITTEPTTGVSFEFVERFSYTILFAVAPLITDYMGYQSFVGFLLYYVWFDIMNEGGHINFEVLPQWWLNSPMRYIFYSPTFHSVHHTKFKKNYSLFMPYTDILFGTAVYSDDKKSSLLPLTNPQSAKGLDFILLVHPSDLESTLYSIKLHPIIAPLLGFTHKLEHKLWMYLFYPYLWIAGIYVSVLDRMGYHYEEEFPFNMEHNTNKSNSVNDFVPVKQKFEGGTWIVRNYGFQYILPSFKNLIKDRIERAILDAQSKNVRVVGLGNFNKAEWMNHGGSDIVEKYKDKLNGTWISHGDTLSAAVVYQYAMRLREEGYWCKSVFITGSTSKIGRAVVLSLAKQQIRVVMFTQVKERFDEIAAEAGDYKSFLVYATSLSEGKSCDLWLTGKMLPRGKELMNAIPQDAVVVNFSVPDPLSAKLLKFRPDILHLDTGLLAYDQNNMSPKFTWLLPNGVIYACLGGSIVHSILGIEAHEVGAVVVDDMVKYWNAALSLGFKIPPPSSFHNRIVMPLPKNRGVTIV